MLRLRLGVLVTAALLVALGASAVLSVTLFERHQLAEMTALLERELDRVVALMANPEVGATLFEAGTEHLALQLVDTGGQVVVPVGQSESLPVSDQPRWMDWQGKRMVVVSAPWTVGGEMVVGTVRLGYDAEEALATRAGLRNSLLLAAVITAALSGLVALLLLGRQLRPLTRLAEEAAQLDPSDPQLDLPQLRDDEVGRVGVALERAVAAIRQRHHSEREALVIASPERLAQIVRNLVRNAVQTASTPAGVRVNVTSDDEHATLEVADDGPGLNADVLAHLFERHYTQRDGHGGSGIGLSIVHDLVLAHGGTVVVLEGPVGGALFRVRLPALGAQLEDG